MTAKQSVLSVLEVIFLDFFLSKYLTLKTTFCKKNRDSILQSLRTDKQEQGKHTQWKGLH